MTRKAIVSLQFIVSAIDPRMISWVVTAKDNGVVDNSTEEIIQFCEQHNIPVLLANAGSGGLQLEQVDLAVAIGWRWLIPENPNSPLFVLHDSLLPRYRGFAPLVSMLIKGETTIGATLLQASAEYDRGAIVLQRSCSIQYPIKIQEAIERIAVLYGEMLLEFLRSKIAGQQLYFRNQDEEEASYSVWRDEDDYLIDWNATASEIARFVDAVGYPYAGAATRTRDGLVRVRDVTVVEDCVVEIRQPGKTLFLDGGRPVVVCGQGMLRIDVLTDLKGEDLIPLKRFRTRFGQIAS